MLFLNKNFYVIGGTLQSDAVCYVERFADKELLSSLKDGKFCYILTSRQMGKSSLMVRTAKHLREEGFAVIVLDLTAVGKNLTPEQWYDGLLNYTGQQLLLEDEIEDCWFENKRLSPLLRWLKVMREVVLKRVSKKIVVFVDEIDTVRSLAFSTDEFFAAIRELYNGRTQNPDLERLTFCLLGVATPSDLIRDTRTTPFNIGQRIEIKDFTETEALALAQGLRREEKLAITLLKRITYWTAGHPFLTQRLCEIVAENSNVNDVKGVDKLCEELFFSNRAKEKDDNLLFVRERLLKSEVDLAGLLELYRQIHKGKRVEDDETNQLISILRLSGIAKFENGQLRVRNRIYEKVFDQYWIIKNMPDAEIKRQLEARRKGQLQVGIIASIIISIMGLLTFFAIKQRNFAEQQELINRRQLYISQMELAYQSWEKDDRGKTKQLLKTLIPDSTQEDLRNFEWNYLSYLSHLEVDTLKIDPAWATSLAFSFDSKILASAGSDAIIRLWDIEKRKDIVSLKGHLGRVTTVIFSPDGKILASAGIDSTIKLWDILSKEEIVTLKGHNRWINSLAFSPDGKLLASAGEDYTTKLWDVVSKKQIATLKSHTNWVNSLAFSPDGKLLATASSDNTAKLWDVESKKEITTLKGHSGWVNSLMFSPSGKLLVTASSDNTAKLWDINSGKEINSLIGHMEEIHSIAFSPDNKLLATVSADKTIKLWDINSCREINTIKDPSSPVYSLAFSPDGKLLATASTDKTIKLWDVSSVKRSTALRGHFRDITSMAFSFEGKFLVTASDDSLIKLWDTTTKEEIITLSGHLDGIRSLAISSDNKFLVTAGLDKSIKLWDLEKKEELFTFNGHSSDINSVALSQNGKFIASASSDSIVKLWDLETKRELTTLKSHTDQVTNVAFSPDNKLLATASNDKSIKIWDLSTMKELSSLTGHNQSITSITFSSDSKLLVSLSREANQSEVKIWDMPTKKQKEHIIEQDINCVTFSPDSKRIVVGKSDGSIKFWDWDKQKLQEISSFKADDKEISSIVFSPDNKSLAIAIRGDKSVKLIETTIDKQASKPLLAYSNKFTTFAPVNLNFEQAVLNQFPVGWFISKEHKNSFSAKITKDRVKNGSLSALLISNMENKPSGYGSLAQSFDGRPYRNKQVKFKVALQTDKPSTKAQLWIKADNKEPLTVSFINSGDLFLTANQWNYHEIVLHIAKDAEKVFLGVILAGNGKVWIDDASFESFEEINIENIEEDKVTNSFIKIVLDETQLGEFITIEAGEFLMGSNSGEKEEQPLHKVIISKAFEIGKYEITQEDWEKVMGENPSNFKGKRLPVEGISWDDVQKFIKVLNSKSNKYIYRLPSEAEWEYAARAKTNYIKDINNLAWHGKNSGLKTHPIGGKQANEWGIYDMYGNVFEWCEDWYGKYLSQTVRDPKGPNSGSLRIFRGGSWGNLAELCKPEFRFYNLAVARDNLVGVRLVRETK